MSSIKFEFKNYMEKSVQFFFISVGLTQEQILMQDPLRVGMFENCVAVFVADFVIGKAKSGVMCFHSKFWFQVLIFVI